MLIIKIYANVLQLYSFISWQIQTNKCYKMSACNAPFTLDEDAIVVERDKGKMTNLLVVAVSLPFVISP